MGEMVPVGKDEGSGPGICPLAVRARQKILNGAREISRFPIKVLFNHLMVELPDVALLLQKNLLKPDFGLIRFGAERDFQDISIRHILRIEVEPLAASLIHHATKLGQIRSHSALTIDPPGNMFGGDRSLHQSQVTLLGAGIANAVSDRVNIPVS